ncbi:MAG: hypothetical protein WCJ09_26665, partial [Planctomycetota bacterium]
RAGRLISLLAPTFLGQVQNQLNSSSFPIGQKYFPYYPYGSKHCPSWGVRARWILGIVLTCLCAGLGTPFWYDLITSLSKLTSSSKKDDKARAPA